MLVEALPALDQLVFELLLQVAAFLADLRQVAHGVCHGVTTIQIVQHAMSKGD